MAWWGVGVDMATTRNRHRSTVAVPFGCNCLGATDVAKGHHLDFQTTGHLCSQDDNGESSVKLKLLC